MMAKILVVGKLGDFSEIPKPHPTATSKFISLILRALPH